MGWADGTRWDGGMVGWDCCVADGFGALLQEGGRGEKASSRAVLRDSTVLYTETRHRY